MARIAILGLGYIGGSIGLGLKKARLKNTEIVGYDDWRRARRTADKEGVADKVVGSVREAVEGAGLVIVATPPAAAEEMFEEMAPHLGRGAAVTDVAASKRVIHAAAADHLPRGVSVHRRASDGRQRCDLRHRKCEGRSVPGDALVRVQHAERDRGIGALGAGDDSASWERSRTFSTTMSTTI